MHQLTSHHETRSVRIPLSQLHFPPPFPHRAPGCSQRLLPWGDGDTGLTRDAETPQRDGTYVRQWGRRERAIAAAEVRLERPLSCPSPPLGAAPAQHPRPGTAAAPQPRSCPVASPGAAPALASSPSPQNAHIAPTPPSPAPAMPRHPLMLVLGPPRAPRIAETPRR